MLYLFICTDFENTADLRMQLLEAHLEFVENNLAHLKVAGPLSEKGESPYQGSIYIITANSRAEANSIFESDPYFQSNIWKSVERKCLQAFAGEWVGGKNW